MPQNDSETVPLNAQLLSKLMMLMSEYGLILIISSIAIIAAAILLGENIYHYRHDVMLSNFSAIS